MDCTIKQHDEGSTIELLLEEYNADVEAWVPMDFSVSTRPGC